MALPPDVWTVDLLQRVTDSMEKHRVFIGAICLQLLITVGFYFHGVQAVRARLGEIEAKRQLDLANTNILGVVLNGIDLKRHYYRYYYGRYYYYRKDEREAQNS